MNRKDKKTLQCNLYFLAKSSLLFFQNSTGQVKIKLHTTICNGFQVIRFNVRRRRRQKHAQSSQRPYFFALTVNFKNKRLINNLS